MSGAEQWVSLRWPVRGCSDLLADAKGEWVIEGYGVDPDINVENDPRSVMAGRDPQLERTVAELLKQLEGKKVKLPPMPAAPVKAPPR